MRVRTLFVVLVLVLLGAFTWLNWAAFTARTPLELLVTRVEAPLGLVMLGVVAVLTVLYAVIAVGVEVTALLEARRHARELLAQRRLAEEAEASRYTELRQYLEAELTRLGTVPTEAAREVIARVDQAEARLKGHIERVGDTLAAGAHERTDRRDRGPDPGAGPS